MKKGFTLVEILISITLIIIIGVVPTMFIKFNFSKKDEELNEQIISAVRMYYELNKYSNVILLNDVFTEACFSIETLINEGLIDENLIIDKDVIIKLSYDNDTGLITTNYPIKESDVCKSNINLALSIENGTSIDIPNSEDMFKDYIKNKKSNKDYYEFLIKVLLEKVLKKSNINLYSADDLYTSSALDMTNFIYNGGYSYQILNEAGIIYFNFDDFIKVDNGLFLLFNFSTDFNDDFLNKYNIENFTSDQFSIKINDFSGPVLVAKDGSDTLYDSNDENSYFPYSKKTHSEQLDLCYVPKTNPTKDMYYDCGYESFDNYDGFNYVNNDYENIEEFFQNINYSDSLDYIESKFCLDLMDSNNNTSCVDLSFKQVHNGPNIDIQFDDASSCDYYAYISCINGYCSYATINIDNYIFYHIFPNYIDNPNGEIHYIYDESVGDFDYHVKKAITSTYIKDLDESLGCDVYGDKCYYCLYSYDDKLRQCSNGQLDTQDLKNQNLYLEGSKYKKLILGKLAWGGKITLIEFEVEICDDYNYCDTYIQDNIGLNGDDNYDKPIDCELN